MGPRDLCTYLSPYRELNPDNSAVQPGPCLFAILSWPGSRTVIAKQIPIFIIILLCQLLPWPVTVDERSKACIVFARSEALVVGSNSTQGMDVWYVFILCLCCPVFR
jgi:hypothetical protein